MAAPKLVAVLLLVALMFHTGLQVNREHLIAVLKNYRLLAAAFVANFILVPLFGVAMVRLFGLPVPIATGVLLMAIAPGVPFVVLSGGRQKGGSLGLAVSLAFLMPLLSLATVPITAALVLPPGEQVSANSIILSLVLFQFIPLLVGWIVSERLPSVAEKLLRPMGLVVLVVIVTLVALLGKTIVDSALAVYGSGGFLAMVCIVVLSLGAGWLLGGATGTHEHRRTLAVGTALRNIGLAAVIATKTFDGGGVSAAVICYLLVQMIIALIASSVFGRFAKREAASSAP